MTVAHDSGHDSPLITLSGQAMDLSRSSAVVMLWAISRARIQRFETARFREVHDELLQLLEDSLGGCSSAEVASAWVEVARSSWWSSDIDWANPPTPLEVAQLNSTGGLAFRVAQKLSDDKYCRQVVSELLALLPDDDSRADLLAGLWLDELVEPHASEAPISWPGLLDSDLASGKHALADAASAGDWDTFFGLLSEEGEELINTWRPGGHSWSTALHHAARAGADEQVVRRLLDLGSWREITDRQGCTPLDLALLEGHHELTELLAPRSLTSVDLAHHRCIQWHLADLLGSVVDLPATRYRVPQVAIIAELPSPLHFDIPHRGQTLVLEFDGLELLVEDRRSVLADESMGYRLGALGVLDSWPLNTVDSPATAKPETGPEITGTPPESEPAPGDYEVHDSSNSVTESVSKPLDLQSIASAMSDYGDAFFTVVPRDLLDQFVELPEANAPGIAITCSDFAKGRRWEQVLQCGSASELVGRTSGMRPWTYLLYITSIFRSSNLDDSLARCLRQEVQSGLGPHGNDEFLAANRAQLREAAMERWGAIHALAADHSVEPQRPGVRVTASGHTRPDIVDTSRSTVYGSPKKETLQPSTVYQPPIRLYLNHARGKGIAEWDGHTVVMKAGSTCSEVPLRSMPIHVQRIRDEMLSSGALVERKRHLLLTRDVEFDKPSNAAAIVTGTSVNGKLLWVDKWGWSINDYLRKDQNGDHT